VRANNDLVHEDFVDEWPPRWHLTAPESHVLSYRGGAWRAETIRLAVTELVARRIVSTVEVEPSGRRRKGPSWALVDGPNAKQSVEPPLDAAEFHPTANVCSSNALASSR
jgi:hypothetical protein